MNYELKKPNFPITEMQIQLRLVVHMKKLIYDDLIVTCEHVTQFPKRCDYSCDESSSTNPKKVSTWAPGDLNNRAINSYAVSAYIDTLKRSQAYRQSVMKCLLCSVRTKTKNEEFPAILMKLTFPKKQFLDYKWGNRLAHMALEKREVDHAMSWLSTLGGAFSALGDHFQHCAQMAGKISAHQFLLALRLDDPLLVARCKLYAALSLIQQGNLRIPRLMIRDIFKYAKEQGDAHLQRMCQGVWAKLRYHYKLERQRRKQRGH